MLQIKVLVSSGLQITTGRTDKFCGQRFKYRDKFVCSAPGYFGVSRLVSMGLVEQGVTLEVLGTVVTFFIKKAHCYHLLVYHLIYMLCCSSLLVFLLSKQMLFSGLNTTWIS